MVSDLRIDNLTADENWKNPNSDGTGGTFMARYYWLADGLRTRGHEVFKSRQTYENGVPISLVVRDNGKGESLSNVDELGRRFGIGYVVLGEAIGDWQENFARVV